MNQFVQFFSEVVERFDKNLLLDINYKLKTQTNEDYLSVLKKSRADDISKVLLLVARTEMMFYLIGIKRKLKTMVLKENISFF